MIAALRVCVRLDHRVWYGMDGQEKEIPAGTAMEWSQVLRIVSSHPLSLVPDEEYELFGTFGFTWAGRATWHLQSGVPIEVAVLRHDGEFFLVPLDDLVAAATQGHTDWDQHLCILAWEQAKLAKTCEVTQPIVLDGSENDPTFGLDDGSDSAADVTLTNP